MKKFITILCFFIFISLSFFQQVQINAKSTTTTLYVVSLGTYKTQNEANTVAAKARKLKYNAYVIKTTSFSYKVNLATYESKTNCDKKDKLR